MLTGYTWAEQPKIIAKINGTNMNAWLQAPSWTSGDYNVWVRWFVYTQLLRDFGFGCQRDVFKSKLFGALTHCGLVYKVALAT